MINLAGTLVPLVLALATVPLYLDVIGQARYGVLTIAWLFLGYFGVFNLGLGRAAGNRIAKLRGAPRAERERVFWTALALNAALGLAGALCLFAAGRLVVGHLLTLPADLKAEMLGGLPWLAAAVPFLTASMVCVGALEGLERFGVVNAIEIATSAVYQLGPLVVAYTLGTELTGLIAAAACAPLLGTLLASGACAFLVPLRGRPSVMRSDARTLFSYGGWVTVSGVVGPLLTVLDRFVIGAVAGARAVTQYTLPLALVTRLTIVPVSLARSLFPRLSFLSDAAARAVSRDATRALAAVTTPLVIAAIVLVEPFLRVWVGHDLARQASPVAQIVLVGIWFHSLAFVPYTFLQARGRPDVPAKLHVLELPPYVLGLWLGLTVHGIEGAATVWALRVTADAALLGAASRLYGRRELALLAPLALVLTTYFAVGSAGDGQLTRFALGTSLAGLAVAWAWRTGPRQLRRLFSAPHATRTAQ
jgi:O-antigen/teichoic acid export membrane protein